MSLTDELRLLGMASQDQRSASAVLSLLTADDLQTGPGQALYRWLAAWVGRGGVVDSTAEAYEAQAADVLMEQARSPGLLATWADARTRADTPPYPPAYATEAIDRARARAGRARMGQLSHALAGAVTTGQIEWAGQVYPARSASDIQGSLTSILVALGQSAAATSATRLGESWETAWNDLLDRQGRGEQPSVWSTGLDGLDELMGGGLKPGKLVIIGGRPAMGKTALALQLALNAVMECAAVGMFSMEMSSAELDVRAIAWSTGISTARIEGSDQLSTEEAETVWATIDGFRRLPWLVTDRPRQSIGQIVTQCRMWAAAGGIDVVVIDYLQLMALPKADRHDIAISQVTSALKAMAKELKCCVILLSQLNRDSEKRTKTEDRGDWRENIARPRMSDLRDSGGIEADADIIMFPLRPTGQLLTDSNCTQAQIEIVKNRAGPTGVVEARWDGPCQRFYDDRAQLAEVELLD